MDTPTRKTISGAGRGWASFFAFLLTLSLILTLVSIVLNNSVFSASFVKDLLVDENVYDQVPALLADTLTNAITDQTPTGTNLLGLLPADKMGELIAAVIPIDYLHSQVNGIVDSVYRFINLQSLEVNYSLNLTPVKENLAGQKGQEALSQLVNSLPECTQDQLNSLASTFDQQGNIYGISIPVCKPTEPLLSVISVVAASSLQSFAYTLPSEITLGGADLNTQIKQLTNTRQFQVYYMVRQWLRWAPWISLAIALLILFVCFRSAKVMFSSLGIPALIAGIFGLLASGGLYFSNGMINTSSFFSDQTGALNLFLVQTGKAFILQVSLFGLLVCGGLFMIGLILTILSGKMSQ